MKHQSVLIVEDDRAYATTLATRCQLMGLKARIAPDAARAVTMLSEHPPDLLLIDAGIPLEAGVPAGDHGLEICSRLDEIVSERIPVIMLTGRRDSQTFLCARHAGAAYVPKSPVAWDSLRPEIEKMLGRKHSPSADAAPDGPDADTAAQRSAAPETALPPAPKILCVDDDPDINLAVGLRLRQLGAQPIRAFNGIQALEIALRERPDLVVTDLHMPEGEGSYLIGRLRSNPITKETPIVVLTARRNIGVARDLERIGANDVLFKPLDLPALLEVLCRFVQLPRYSN